MELCRKRERPEREWDGEGDMRSVVNETNTDYKCIKTINECYRFICYLTRYAISKDSIC